MEHTDLLGVEVGVAEQQQEVIQQQETMEVGMAEVMVQVAQQTQPQEQLILVEVGVVLERVL
jgi:hypothetical protein